MEKPFVVCHMFVSMDGKIDGAFMGDPNAIPARNEYGKLRNFYNCTAAIYGTTTMKAFADGVVGDLPAAGQFSREDYVAPHYLIREEISMKVLLVNGGPHKEGCTNAALCEVAAALNKEGIGADLFWVGTKPIGGCIGCRGCAQKGECVFDDKVNEFLSIAGDYDGFVFGTPVHWGAATGAITSFLDRAFYADFCSGGSRFLLKPAATVISARRAGTTATWDQLNKYFGLMQMPIITSRYWNMVHGAHAEEIRQDEEGVQIMRILGKNMAWFLKCKELAAKAGLPLPEQETINFTNFVR